MHHDQFLATCDAAKVLGCTPDNVRSLERRGRLSAMRTPGGRRIFRALDVERLAMERRGHPGEESAGN
ncbi:MAG: MerR family DNA-binding transcriptional regulator [Nitrospira sp.]|nr:MAG: MerR family DNA-binding transcriptional regulator [Nitrospira sp.]